MAKAINGCRAFIDARRECEARHGGIWHEECDVPKLREKQCLSHGFCPTEAALYYGAQRRGQTTTTAGGVGQAPTTSSTKALCSSWAESFAFLSDWHDHDESVVSQEERKRHMEAQTYVNDPRRKALKKECRELAYEMSKCLQRYSNANMMPK
jgi:hypothetical protein